MRAMFLVISWGMWVGFAVAGAAEEPVLLRHQFPADGTLTFARSHDARYDVVTQEDERQMEHSSDSQMLYAIESVDADGNATVVVTVESVVMTADDGQKTVRYDSSSKTKPHKQFADVVKTVGKPLTRMTVSPTGEVTQVTPLLNQATPSDATAQADEHVFIKLPEEAVTVGDKWSESFKTVVQIPKEYPAAVKMKRTYTLKSVDDGLAKIAWRTITLTPVNDSRLENELAQRELHGVIVFDIDAGQMISRQASVDRTVVGFNGGGSKMRSVISRSEKLQTSEDRSVTQR